MTNPLFWFQCEPGPLLGALAGMRPTEGYVYTIVLLRIYESGGICRDTIDCLATRTRFNRKVVSDALDRLFKAGRLYRVDDGIRNPKADEKIASAEAISEKRKTRSKKAANARWKKDKKNQRNGHANAMLADAQLESQLQLQEDSPLSPPLPGGTRKRVSKGFVLPDDWNPKDSHYAKGEQLGFGRAMIDGFAERMRNWAGANAHRPVAKKSDWDLAFHNWISDKAERRGNDQPNNGGMNGKHREGGRSLGAAGLAATLRRKLADQEKFGDAAGCGSGDGFRDPAPLLVGMERVRKT